jgi:hypothetical protein
MINDAQLVRAYKTMWLWEEREKGMDEGTIKTPSLKVVFTGVFVSRGVAILKVLNLSPYF